MDAYEASGASRWMRTTRIGRPARSSPSDPINPEVAVLGTQKDGLWLTTDGGRDLAPRSYGAERGTNHRHRLRRVERQHERANEASSTPPARAAGVHRKANAGASLPADPRRTFQGRDPWRREGRRVLTRRRPRAVALEVRERRVEGLHSRGRKGCSSDPRSRSIRLAAGRLPWRRATARRSHISTDNGATWAVRLVLRGACALRPDAPWLCKAYEAAYLSNAAMMFDPVVAGRLWMVRRTRHRGTPPFPRRSPRSRGRAAWRASSSSSPTSVIVPPGGKPVVASWDFGLVPHRRPRTVSRRLRADSALFGAAWLATGPARTRVLVAFCVGTGLHNRASRAMAVRPDPLPVRPRWGNDWATTPGDGAAPAPRHRRRAGSGCRAASGRRTTRRTGASAGRSLRYPVFPTMIPMPAGDAPPRSLPESPHRHCGPREASARTISTTRRTVSSARPTSRRRGSSCGPRDRAVPASMRS